MQRGHWRGRRLLRPLRLPARHHHLRRRRRRRLLLLLLRVSGAPSGTILRSAPLADRETSSEGQTHTERGGSGAVLGSMAHQLAFQCLYSLGLLLLQPGRLRKLLILLLDDSP